MSSPAPQAHLDQQAKFSMTLPHSSLGIALIATVIAAFRSGIVWGLLPYTLVLTYTTDKNLGIQSKSGECGDHCWSHLRLINQAFVHLMLMTQNHWHMINRFLMSSGVSFCLICILKGYMWRSAIKILRTDSRLIPSSWLRQHTDFLGCGQQSLWKQQHCVVSLMILVVQSVIVC